MYWIKPKSKVQGTKSYVVVYHSWGGRDCYWPTLIGATRSCSDPAKNWRTQEPMTMGHRLLVNVSKFYIMSFLCLLYYLPHYKELIAEKKKKN